MPTTFEKEVKRFLGPRGPLKKLLPRYEDRPEQGQMASAVLRAMSGRSVLIVEAGTGTGKTLSYLVPAIYYKERVVISTGTKALQEQLMNKDLPVLEKEFEINAALVKGRSNYLCRRRYREFSGAPVFSFRNEAGFYERIVEWAKKTETGDRAEIKGLPDDFSAWRDISATGEQCLGQKCGFFEQCFVTRMRARAQQADILVVNHHLFFADLAIRHEAPSAVLPHYSTVIFDEAHNIAETAAEYFGVQASTWRLADLSQDIRRLQRAGSLPVEDLRSMLKSLESAESETDQVFRLISERAGRGGEGESSRFSLGPVKDDTVVMEGAERAVAGLKGLAASLASLGRKEESIMSLAERASSLADDLALIAAQEDPDYVYWAEMRGRGVFLRASPAELGPIMAEKLLADSMPLVFTSATLAVQSGGRWSFDHFKEELGLDQARNGLSEIWLPSSYDWKNQAMLYVPAGMPEPNSPEFIVQASREMLRILRITHGRAFLLFTSHRNMEAAHELLSPHLDYTVLKQGDAPKSEILSEFRHDESSVLFGTQSFWAGVDVSGQSLSAVVIDKLPFASPGDPLVSARISRIRERGGNPFQEYQLPSAVITLKQGLGRLIRSKEDYGVLAVLDSRIRRKSYGKTFINSLPPAPLTTRLSDLEKFFDRHEGGSKKS